MFQLFTLNSLMEGGWVLDTVLSLYESPRRFLTWMLFLPQPWTLRPWNSPQACKPWSFDRKHAGSCSSCALPMPANEIIHREKGGDGGCKHSHTLQIHCNDSVNCCCSYSCKNLKNATMLKKKSSCGDQRRSNNGSLWCLNSYQKKLHSSWDIQYLLFH